VTDFPVRETRAAAPCLALEEGATDLQALAGSLQRETRSLMGIRARKLEST